MTQEEIMDKFPILYQDRDKPCNESLMCFGFECGPGWFQIIHDLSEKIEEWNRLHPDCPTVAAQVKEKFGGLRFYVNQTPDEIYAFINEAEDRAYRTCEDCGSTDNVQTSDVWMSTLCEKCRGKTKNAQVRNG